MLRNDKIDQWGFLRNDRDKWSLRIDQYLSYVFPSFSKIDSSSSNALWNIESPRVWSNRFFFHVQMKNEGPLYTLCFFLDRIVIHNTVFIFALFFLFSLFSILLFFSFPFFFINSFFPTFFSIPSSTTKKNKCYLNTPPSFLRYYWLSFPVITHGHRLDLKSKHLNTMPPSLQATISRLNTNIKT